MAKFTVDTHLFRELGELLVGRDSTALVELIKNSYDADATVVTVYGEHLDQPDRGRIIITDDGIGMTEEVFTKGFLCIASRIKEGSDRRSPIYKRRFTGAKGIGRLAAHKLAHFMSLLSIPDPKVSGSDTSAISATIDWKLIESLNTLDDIEQSGAVTLYNEHTNETPGTEIELSKLRRKWTPSERTRVIREVQTFQPPDVLLNVPPSVCVNKLLFDTPIVRDVSNKNKDKGFEVRLEGDFAVGEDYWPAVAQAADWILEIKSDRNEQNVEYHITPTKTCHRKLPKVEQHEFVWDSPNLEHLPSITARVLIRAGSGKFKRSQQSWLVGNAGIKIYMEGFRVLPYGESGNDWLEIDSDSVRRFRSLRFLDSADIESHDLNKMPSDTDEGLHLLTNRQYYGAVFLTRNTSPDLNMLVNREGFIPNAAFDSLVRLIRVGIDLSVRVRLFENQPGREERRRERVTSAIEKAHTTPERFDLREQAEESVRDATELAKQARTAAASGKHKEAAAKIDAAAEKLRKGTGLTSELTTDRSIMQILAGVGLQMSSFVHEMNGLLGMASAVEAAVADLREKLQLDFKSRRLLARLQQNVSDLRRVIERQASYLTDITSPDARRRRSRQNISKRYEKTIRLVQRAADKRMIHIKNQIDEDLKTPPMFPAELMIVFSNLLTNAIKACQRNGSVRATGKKYADGSIRIRIENTGRKVGLRNSEKWFLPFKSTTVEADPVLGQGMGMGLPIVRNILEEYGAIIQFTEPRGNYATALEIIFT